MTIKIGSKVADAFDATAVVIDIAAGQAKLRWNQPRLQVQGSWMPLAALREIPADVQD
jgi:hypothetical protein